MKDCNSVSTPTKVGVKLVQNLEWKTVDCRLYKQLVWIWMCLTATILDIMQSMSLISRYMDCQNDVHLLAATKFCAI